MSVNKFDDNDVYESMKESADEIMDEAQLHADDRKDEVLPEAPAVSNVKVWIKGYGVMLTVRGEKVMDIVKKTETLIDYAQSHGWKNRWDDVLPQVPAVVGQQAAPQAPTCGIHGTLMTWKTGTSKTTGKPYAFWSCSTKNANGSYCSFKPTK